MKPSRSVKSPASDRNPFCPVRPDQPLPWGTVVASATLVVSILAAGALAADMLLGGLLLDAVGMAIAALIRWPALILLPFLLLTIGGRRNRS